MWLKITQRFQEWFKEIGSMNTRQILNSDLLRSSLILLAITILSFELINLFYKIISIPLTQQTIALAGNRISSFMDNTQHRQLQDYGIITERNLFLTTLRSAGGNEGFADSDQKNMDFDLKGTVACNSSFGFIIVEERDKHKQKLYRLGDKIGSRKLTKITRNTAILQNEEGEITLKVKESLEGSLISTSPATQRSSVFPSVPIFAKKNMGKNINFLESIMNQAVVRPFMNRGIRQGYIISNIAPNSLYEKAGLQNGDIIIDINKNKMRNVTDIMQLLGSMQSGNRIELSVMRRGKIENLDYTLE
ncbi:MAG: PDZ domain-containing protein [Syntrophaceae bacterium]|nr:PDZ domain-containing protein [Syntrophaceae bacterium]